ncbi:hypothetical protein [Pelosinus baikalensis]|uniref:Uncharacterized protein n=1 Tax=Pelosinus baikalensis TaxID=2892015 RepID=A0ABS8HYS4_9FIRM|nr:hypothetical protein [Pelosinus baikalensis]MCC5468328.1 hypothetical protein [Pelosinus baikalensis]
MQLILLLSACQIMTPEKCRVNLCGTDCRWTLHNQLKRIKAYRGEREPYEVASWSKSKASYPLWMLALFVDIMAFYRTFLRYR